MTVPAPQLDGSALPWLPQQPARSSLCVVIPCLNEAATIGKVVRDFRRVLPQAEVIVFDNRSTDRSAEEAVLAGATVFSVGKRGKGNVLRAAFDQVKADFYVIVDADDTYAAEDVVRLLQPVRAGDADMVVGARSIFSTPDAISRLHRVGNTLIVGFLNFCFGTRLRDVLSGYRVLSGEMVLGLPLLANGFEVETEILLEALERGFQVHEIPITYRPRREGSHSKLSAFRDGYRILTTIVVLLRDFRPMTFFGALAGFLIALGLLGGAAVVSGYLETGFVTRLPLAVLASALVLLGCIVFLTGFIVSALNRRFAEMNALLRRWERERRRAA